MPAHLDLARLGPLTQVGSGGQGVVFAAPGLRMQYASSLVFKQYKPDVARALDVAVLESMPGYLESLPSAAGMELLSQAAWPCRLVDDRGVVAGFVMPAIPDRFFVQMRKSSGMSRELGEFQHLLNDDSFLARRQIDLSDRHRYELLGEVARALWVFHRHGIAVGDLSPKNLLYAHQSSGVYFIDCDAMRFQGRSVMRQLETPGWEVRAVSPREELGTSASDSYKLGLLALRLLVGSQDARDPARLPRTVPEAVRRLIEAALSPDPARRPAPGQWINPLATAAATAPTTTPQPPPATQVQNALAGPIPTWTPARQTPAPTPGPRPAVPSQRSPSRKVAAANPAATRSGTRSLSLGLAAIALAGTLVAVFAIGGSSPRNQAAGSAGTASPSASPHADSGLLDLSSSQTLSYGTNYLASGNQVVDIGNSTLGLVSPSGHVAWFENADINDLATDVTSASAPQVSGNCAIASSGSGIGDDAEFISLRTGAQHLASGDGVLNGAEAAWSDGTIRNACTGAVLGRAAPPGALNTPECLDGSIVIGQDGTNSYLSAWQAGHELWSKSSNYLAVCDSSGTAALLNSIAETITLINPSTGAADWQVSDPMCASPSYNECITNPTSPVSLAETRNVVILSTMNIVLAFKKNTGRLLWQRSSVCALAARSSPREEALIGPCTEADSNDNGEASVVNAVSGATIRTLNIGDYDQWTANSHVLLAVNSSTGATRETSW